MLRRQMHIKSRLKLPPNWVAGLSSLSESENLNHGADIVTQVRNSVQLETDQARKCVLIPWVFRRNVTHAINLLQDTLGIPAEQTIFFNDNTGLGKKPVLLVKMKEKVPWESRFKEMRFSKKTGPLPDVRGIRMDIVKYKELSPTALNRCENLLDQIYQLYDTARMSPHVRLCHNTVISVLIDCMRSQDPEMFTGDILPFGSGPCGLALQESSDLDLVYLEDNKYQDKEERQHFLRTAAKRLRAVTTLSDIVPILGASVPILRFTESTTDLNVDLSVSSRDGVRFCKLFEILDDLDNRIHPLIVTLRFWSKVNRLQSIQLSNFVLTMLVVHFLQYQNIIPPFRRLIKDFQEMKLPSPNKSKLDNLLVEFFKFYSTFDFNRNTISLYNGTSNIRSFMDVKYSEILLMENPFIPYCETQNIGKSVTPIKLEKFQRLCISSCQLLQEHRQKSNKNEEWGLNRILPCR